MKKLVIATFMFLFTSQIAYANPSAQMIQGILDQMQSSIASDCANEATLSCMDISTKQCIKIKQGILENCTKPALNNLEGFSEDSLEKVQSENIECTIEYVTDKHDIDLQKFVGCVGQDSFDADALEAIDRN